MSSSLLTLDNCCNLACTDHSTLVHPELSKHSETFKQGIYKVNDIFYLAVGYGLSNVTMIEGNDGVIIIDTGESYEVAINIAHDFKKITHKPVKCVIYTHNHLDHIAGVKAFTTKEQVDNGDVKIYAHRKIMEGVINNASVIGPIINARAISTFGLTLETYTGGHINDAIGPKLKTGITTFIHPTDFVDEVLTVTSCGITMILRYAPSETDDEIFIHFPDFDLVQSADIIMGESYPNLYSIRGTHNRDAVNWYTSIDKIRALRPKYLLPSHGRPLEGKEEVYAMLTAYRDAIQFTHDQTIRYMNKGYTPDELVTVINELPENLKNHPWLQEHYGTVIHSVKQIYHGYLGWFQGDPTFLDTINPRVKARNYVDAFGGEGKTLSIACSSIKEGDYKWAAEVLTYLITLNPEDKNARTLKACCLRELGYKCKNSNWRNWYLTSSKELDGSINYSQAAKMHGCDAMDIINEIPISIFLKCLCTRLNTQLSAEVGMIMEFNILSGSVDHSKNIGLYFLEIRHSIVEFHENKNNIIGPVHYSINIFEHALKDLFLKNISLVDVITKGLLTFNVGTNLMTLQQFFGYFEIDNAGIPFLALPHV
jgi:alkyl sulfatase BDS1-like metallo-beta-lactamase superfamily hydrolase